METEGRPKHGARRRCSDPKEKGCKGFARRNTVPPTCSSCGGGSRASTKHRLDEEGNVVTTKRGLVAVPPRVQALLDGDISVEDLDDEELARGYPRASDGSFRCPPSVVPRSLHDRMVRELFARANTKLKQNLTKTVEAMTKIALDPEVDAATRLRAGTWLVERVMGKVPDVSVSVEEKRYEKLLDRIHWGGIVVNGEVLDDGREP